jgi:hypothetical protein
MGAKAIKRKPAWIGSKHPCWMLVFVMLCTANRANAQRWTAEIFAGTAWSLPMPLLIEQPGEKPIHFKARYSTRPWKGSPYYAYRLGYQQWTAELVHHKVYLENPPPEIEHFEVSHGYNLAYVSRMITEPAAPLIFRLGLGLVIGHPEGRIRGNAINPVKSFLGGGYHISGISLQLGISRRLGVGNNFFVNPDAKLTAAWARMPLAGGGFVQVPNVALHTLLGLGYRSRKLE